MLNHAAGRGFFDDPPIPFLSFELIGNLDGGAGGCSVLWAEADIGGGLIILDDDGGEIRIEGLHVERTERREMLTHCGANSFVAGRLLFAARGESKNQGTRRDGGFVKELFHGDVIQNCSAIFVKARTLIPVAFRACGGQTKTLLLPCVGLVGARTGDALRKNPKRCS